MPHLKERIFKIYKIEDCDGLIYVGATSQTLKHRLRQHRYDQEVERNNCSSGLLKLDHCTITEIESNIPSEKRKERERYWINFINSVNLRTLDNELKRPEKAKAYYNKNKDKILQQRHEKYISRKGKKFQSRSKVKYITYDKRHHVWKYQGGLHGNFRQKTFHTKKDAIAAKFGFELLDRIRGGGSGV